MKESKKLRRSQILAALAVLAALFAMTGATFAWYIYNTSARTTEVKMVAGSSTSLQIAKEETDDFKSYIDLDETDKFEGLLNPVSTDKISGGFQRAEWFDREVNDETGEERLFAALFGKAEERVDYHKTYLYLRTNADELDIYLSDIGFQDANEDRPLSTALRLGLVTPDGESIFEVSTLHDKNRGDNADKIPRDGYVLDSRATDGTTIAFTAFTSANFCAYDPETGAVTPTADSRKLCTIYGDGKGGYGKAVKVELYLWLEGCDMDCSLNLAGQTLETLSLNFVGASPKGG